MKDARQDMDLFHGKVVVACDDEFQEKIVEATAFAVEYVRMRGEQEAVGLPAQSFIQDCQRTNKALRVAKEAIEAWRRTRV